MVLRLASAAFGLSGGSILGVATAAPSSLSLAEITQLIIAITGLVAAVSAFILGLRSRQRDPRDKLLEMLLDERKEAMEHDEPEQKPAPRRRRRREP